VQHDVSRFSKSWSFGNGKFFHELARARLGSRRHDFALARAARDERFVVGHIIHEHGNQHEYNGQDEPFAMLLDGRTPIDAFGIVWMIIVWMIIVWMIGVRMAMLVHIEGFQKKGKIPRRVFSLIQSRTIAKG
jgi:hypothetical protein